MPGKGEVVAHLADPGRLPGLLVPDRRLGLRPEPASATRSTWWTALLVEAQDADGALTEFRGWSLARWEAPHGASRLDFLLARESGGAYGRGGRECLHVETRSVTLVENGIALFPDAVTARGARHLEELICAVEEGHRAAVLFVLQRPDARRIVAARSIDPVFADTLARAEEAGVSVLGRRCSVAWEGIRLGGRVPAGAG